MYIKFLLFFYWKMCVSSSQQVEHAWLNRLLLFLLRKLSWSKHPWTSSPEKASTKLILLIFHSSKSLSVLQLRYENKCKNVQKMANSIRWVSLRNQWDCYVLPQSALLFLQNSFKLLRQLIILMWSNLHWPPKQNWTQ